MSLRLVCLLAALAAGPMVGCAHETPIPQRGHGVLVVAVDALRMDHLGLGGYDRDTTPTLDAFAREAVVFETAWATAPQLIPSHVSILTGCDPNLARRPMFPGAPQNLMTTWFVPRTVPRLAREYLAAGFATAAWVDHPWLKELFGFAEGFESFRPFVPSEVRSELQVGFEGVALPFLRWLGRLDHERNWFAYLSVNDLERALWPTQQDPRWDTYFHARPELSYVPPLGQASKVFFAVPRNRWSGGSRSLGEYEAEYDGAVCKLDQKLGRLFDRLRRLDRWDDTTIVVVGTFGISFGESGLLVDTGTLSDCDLHVPVIVKPARSSGVPDDRLGARIGSVFSLIDLAPTLLELSGIRKPSGMHGVSHAQLVQGSGEPPRANAFASCAMQDGFAVVDETSCYEYLRPGSMGPGPLTASWFGDTRYHRDDYRRYLHDRSLDPSAGHMGKSLPIDERANETHRIGQDWFDWIDKARLALHPTPWSEAAVSDEDLSELRRRGLVPYPDSWTGIPLGATR